jgi:hypothetical protein
MGRSFASLQRIRRGETAIAPGKTLVEQGEGEIEMGRELVQRERIHAVQALGHELAKLRELGTYGGVVKVETRTAAERHFYPRMNRKQRNP